MAVKTRNDLKKRFQTGMIPTQADFADMIDSALNSAEEIKIGLKSPSEFGSMTKAIIAFYSEFMQDKAAWTVGTDSMPESPFSIKDSDNKPVLSISKGGGQLEMSGMSGSTLSVKNDAGRSIFDIGGMASMSIVSVKNNAGRSIFDIGGMAGSSIVSVKNDAGISVFDIGDMMGSLVSVKDSTGKVCLSVSNGGNVGIGVDSPTAKLHVNGDALITGNMTIGREGANTELRFPNGLNKIKMWNHANGVSFYGFEIVSSTLRLQTDSAASDIIMGFRITTGDGFTETMRIKGNGNVGIGVDSPTAKLHVGGDALINTNLSLNGNIKIGNGTNNSIETAKFEIDAGTSSYGIPFFPQSQTTSKSLIQLSKRITVFGNEGTGEKFISEFNHDVYMKTKLVTTAADFTEFFESENKTEIPVGTSVMLNQEGLIKAAESGDIPIGVISSAPAILGNSASEWPQKYLKDEFGRQLTEEATEEVKTPNGEIQQIKVFKPILNPKYDPTKEYLSREFRPEWHPVGLLGQILIRKGQPVAPTWVKIKDISDNVELWLVK